MRLLSLPVPVLLLARILALAPFLSGVPVIAQVASQPARSSGDAIRCASGKPEVAIVACGNIVKDKREGEENRAIALRNRAYHYQQIGDLERAIADYTTALVRPEQRALRAKLLLNRGVVYFQHGDEPLALQDLGKALASDPALLAAYLSRATILIKRGDDAQALADLDQATRLSPNDAAIYVMRASVYARRGDPGRAIADYSKAIEIDPKNALAWRNRGFVYRDSGNQLAAANDAAEAIRLDPKLLDAQAYKARGDMYLSNSDPERAIAAFTDAVKAIGSPEVRTANDPKYQGFWVMGT